MTTVEVPEEGVSQALDLGESRDRSTCRLFGGRSGGAAVAGAGPHGELGDACSLGLRFGPSVLSGFSPVTESLL